MEMTLAFAFNADPDDPREEPDEASDDDDDYNPGGYEAVYCFEDELEIMAILSAQEIPPDFEEYGDNNTRIYLNSVTFYDNDTYEKLRTLVIDQKVKCGKDRGLITMDLDRDLLMIRIKENQRNRTLVWRLSFLEPKIDIDGNKSVTNDAVGKALNEEEGSSEHRKSSRQKKKTSRSQPESNWEPERTRTTRSASKKI